MPNNFQKMIFNLSAGIPLVVIFAIVWWIQKGTYLFSFVLIILSFIGCILFLIFWNYGKKNLQVVTIRVSEVVPKDVTVIAYMSSYVLPFTPLVIDSLNFEVLFFISVSIVLIAPFINSAIANPLLFIVGYHFYEVSGEHGAGGYMLISKRKIRKSKDVKEVQQMYEFLLIDKEK